MLSLLLNGIRNGNLDFGSVIAEILAVLVIIFLILPFHEWAHAFTASLLGDKAVKGRGISIRFWITVSIRGIDSDYNCLVVPFS